MDIFIRRKWKSEVYVLKLVQFRVALCGVLPDEKIFRKQEIFLDLVRRTNAKPISAKPSEAPNSPTNFA